MRITSADDFMLILTVLIWKLAREGTTLTDEDVRRFEEERAKYGLKLSALVSDTAAEFKVVTGEE